MSARMAHSSSIFSLASSDIDLHHRVANFLHQQHVPDEDGIRLGARGGVVVVSGELPSPHAKWLCIECCRRVAGVLKIVDELTVAQGIVKLPASNKKTAQFKSGKQDQHDATDCRAVRLFDPDSVGKAAATGNVAANQKSRLLPAA